MTFDIRAIVVFSIAGLLYAGLLPNKWRSWFLLIASVVAIYWLQPPLPIRFSDYIFPTATLFLCIIAWYFSRKQNDVEQNATVGQDRATLVIIVGVIIGMAFMRFVDGDYRLTASRPPSPIAVAAFLLFLAIFSLAVWRVLRHTVEDKQRQILTLLIILLIGLFVILKTEVTSTWISRLWRQLTGQDTNLASPIDLAWLGFSFVAFRLIHTLRDRQTGLLPAMSLREFMSYAIFFPAYTAGPIDRAERFVVDFRALPGLPGMDPKRLGLGAWRIALGMFKKFVIADTLAQGLSITAASANQSESSIWLWVLLYGYSLRLYFDFAGYTDIAIGIGILFGIRLPENFDKPYLKSSITEFWQSWHITLSNWVRFYVFSPLSRWLLTREWRPSTTVIVFVAQLTTMSIIGLWHGITWNFFIWGIWHGLGLFVHKQWSDRSRKWYRELSQYPGRKQAWTLFSWFITFNFVVLGWVWFALPTVELSIRTFARLFGVAD